ncbi:DUF4189 domain-containing protein [Frigidibacter sp. RF13]|uniref:DUF4189 domain-containing protein n=1 Tax=Frigidibacter sp. RF13 TaxID=2997340 RepID=UPI002270CA69|nr:DUF4189 domain-containing protein [Frigidibacter sp. RF13]MCY1125799.1 DUF4189 domain-containing protein [Frigidibacter sp. RF13]
MKYPLPLLNRATLARTALPAFALFGLMPVVAAAQGYPCPSGPGPGEVMIGTSGGGASGIAEVPICVPAGSGGYAPGPSGYWSERFAAIAWGNEADGRATYAYAVDYPSVDEAINAALGECRRRGFQDCRQGTDVANGSLAIVVAADGTLFSDWGKNGRQARSKALKECRKQTGKKCMPEKVIDSPAVWMSY